MSIGTGYFDTLSAGMIAIKWNGEQWEITTKQDTDWYNYKNGKPAYMMLNDGYYKSELERGVEKEQLMQNNVGEADLDDPNTEIHTRHNLHVYPTFCIQQLWTNSIHKTRV